MPLVVGLLAGLVLLLGGGTVLAWWVLGHDDEPLATGEVFLEGAAVASVDPFTPTMADLATPVPPLVVEPTAEALSLPTMDPAARSAVLAVPASQPGLYGGTRDDSSCDVPALVDFLATHPDQARAFAQVQSLEVTDLDFYLRHLTPVLLRTDTRVTNHGYRDGRATPRHAVLEAGTAVLVDVFGISRVRCACGNPLLPPEPVMVTPTYQGVPWQGFGTRPVVSIVNVTEVVVDKLVIIDIATGSYLERTAGGAVDRPILVDELCDLYPGLCVDGPVPVEEPVREGEPELATGDVQVTLRWEGSADLDLAVTGPDGETINFGQMTSSSGGFLDVDANAACNEVAPAPVENIVWGEAAPDGRYLIRVHLWSLCEASGPVPFDLSVRIGGRLIEARYLGTSPQIPAALRPFEEPLARSATGTVSPDQPDAYFLVEKSPVGEYDRPPSPAPTPEPAPDPSSDPGPSPDPAPGPEPTPDMPEPVEPAPRPACEAQYGCNCDLAYGPEEPMCALCCHVVTDD